MTTTPYPTPPDHSAGVGAHVDYFVRILRATTKLGVSTPTVARLRTYFGRVGEGNYEDLTAWIFLECWREYQSRETLTDEIVLLAADRVRQRLTREAKRFRDGPAAEYGAVSELPPDEAISLVLEEFHTFLRTRDARDAVLFQQCYLNGRTPAQASSELGIPLSTVYRRLKAIRDDFQSITASKTRPTASD